MSEKMCTFARFVARVRDDVPAGGGVAQGRGEARNAWVMAATQQ